MTAITIEKFAGKMNRLGYDAFLQAMRQARGDGNRNVELSHWLFHAISHQDGDISVTLRGLGLDRGRVLKDLGQAMDRLQKNVTETPGISERLADALNHAWTYATLFFGEAQIRTGHLLVALLNDLTLRREVAIKILESDLAADATPRLAGSVVLRRLSRKPLMCSEIGCSPVGLWWAAVGRAGSGAIPGSGLSDGSLGTSQDL